VLGLAAQLSSCAGSGNSLSSRTGGLLSSNITDDVGRSLRPFVSPQILELIQEQMRRLANSESGGLLTFGVAGALWSSSAALVSASGLNRAYDIDEGRPWWQVRLIATGISLFYYFGPDADQDWAWITHGAVAATVLWLLVSLLFKIYVARFTDYAGSYNTVDGIMVVLLCVDRNGRSLLQQRALDGTTSYVWANDQISRGPTWT
jgi:membrane protein